MSEKSLIGKEVLGYIVEEEIGSGGFGTVYKVSKQNIAGCYIKALKHITVPSKKQYNAVLNSMGGDYEKADNYFKNVLNDIVNEIKILNSLSEENANNIVSYYENHVEEKENPKTYDVYILMEYLTPYTDFFEQEKLTIRDVIDLGLDILSALKVCHANNIIHRDIKEDNIFVTKNKKYKLGDFGVSKITNDKAQAESVKGTLSYIAPEVYLGKEKYTSTVDLYSLGIVLYRLLNYSRSPFLPKYPEVYTMNDEERAFEERMRGITPELPSKAPKALGEVIVKSISDKESRYLSVHEFYEELLNVKNSLSEQELNENINDNIVKNNLTCSTVTPNPFLEGSRGDSRNITMAEGFCEVQDTLEEDEQDTDINRNLFKSIGANPSYESYEVPDSNLSNKVENKLESVSTSINNVELKEKIKKQNNFIENKSNIKAFDFKWIKFSMPVIIALIGIIIAFVIIPNKYDNMISFADFLFTDKDKIVETLRDSNIVIPKVYTIILTRVGLYIYIASFSLSLFIVGKELNKKPEYDEFNAILKGKDAYYRICDINYNLKKLSKELNDESINKVLKKSLDLEENLKFESDFGHGNSKVIDCENYIAKLLDNLKEAVSKIEVNKDKKSLDNIINELNYELKKRRDYKIK